jgi:hypothetical protein
MSYEHFYWFLDRKAADAVLRMPWTRFLERHSWPEDELQQVLEFAVEPSPGPKKIRSMLQSRTLAWTVQHAAPALYLVDEIIQRVPAVEKKGAIVPFWDCQDFETLAINAAAARAFIDGRIPARMLRAVFAIHGEYVLDLQFDLQRVEPGVLQKVERAIQAGPEPRPFFSWLKKGQSDEGYYWLRESDTKLFLQFVTEAWAGNWPLLPLDPEVMTGLELDAKTLKFRRLPLARKLAAAAKKLAGRDLALVRYFELEVL